MTQRRSVAVALALVFVALASYTVRADVRADEKTRFEFAGMLGKFVNMFAGKAAKEGVTSTVAIKGDRGARMNENDGQIIDLAEEKIYQIDMKKKSYRVTTFAELRRQMEEAQKKMQEEARKAEAKGPAQADAKNQTQEPNVEIDFNLKNTGEKKTINGFETRQEVMTITVREKGKTLEQAGGLVLTSDMWIAPRIPAMKEVQDFYMKFAQKLYGNRNMLAGADAGQMATMMAMYPMMKQAIAKMNTEGERIQGTPILTTMTVDAVKSEEQLAQEAKANESSDSKKTPTSVGGLLGGFGKKIAAKKAGGGTDEGAKPRVTILTGSTEVMKVATEVGAADVAVPAGFKESK